MQHSLQDAALLTRRSTPYKMQWKLYAKEKRK